MGIFSFIAQKSAIARMFRVSVGQSACLHARSLWGIWGRVGVRLGLG